MISRLLLPIVAAILFVCVYQHRYGWHHRWLRLLGWLVGIVGIYATISLSLSRDYFPDNINHLVWYLHLLCVVVIPAFLYTLCAFVGRLLRRPRGGRCVGLVLAVICVAGYLYGTLVGSRQFEVVKVRYAGAAVPAAFDGYRIVHFGDAHVGTYVGDRQAMLQQIVDAINAQDADMVVFTGDLQNKRPEEVDACCHLLSSIKARDGVYAVLGNHDYAEYQGGDAKSKAASCAATVDAIRHLGWDLLLNEHRVVRRGGDSIVVAGMENDGEGRFPQKGDIAKTLDGVGRGAFVVMLEHDPTSWLRKIVPDGRAQLTLSGHTHGGQIALFGWSPARLAYRQVNGIYQEGSQTLYVTKGAGGVIPFRLGAPCEIVVMTLRTK